MATTLLQIQLRGDTTIGWTSADPVLLAGEVGIELSTGKFKIGTGTLSWNNLSYAAALPAEITPAALLTALKTVDGTGSGLDAALLEGKALAEVVQVTGGTMTGALVLNGLASADLQAAPKQQVDSLYTAATLTVGKAMSAIVSVTVPPTLVVNAMYYIYNNSDSTISIVQDTGLLLRLAGSTSTGNRQLLPRGLCVIWAISASEAVIAGAGVL